VWQLSQYSDSLEAGPHAVCLLAEAGDFPSLQYIRPALGPTFYSAEVVDYPQVFKQLLHESDHSPLFSAEVTDQCSWNCASPVCLHGVHTDIFTVYDCF